MLRGFAAVVAISRHDVGAHPLVARCARVFRGDCLNRRIEREMRARVGERADSESISAPHDERGDQNRRRDLPNARKCTLRNQKDDCRESVQPSQEDQQSLS